MTTEHIIFVGFELTDELKSELVANDHRDRVYLEDPAYLETIVIDGLEYVGKRTRGGIAIDRLDDMARNVVSLMQRVSTDWDSPSSGALVIACEQDDRESENQTPEPSGFDYSGLVD